MRKAEATVVVFREPVNAGQGGAEVIMNAELEAALDQSGGRRC